MDGPHMPATTPKKILDTAVTELDRKFGDGYAKRNPNLVQGFLQIIFHLYTQKEPSLDEMSR